MKKKYFALQLAVLTALVIVGITGCWYSQDDEHHPTAPDRTGVQGWTINLTVTPSTAPANGSSVMNAQARFWNLEDRTGVSGANIYFSLLDETYMPVDPAELHFADGGTVAEITTDALGLATLDIFAGYLPLHTSEKIYYLKAEATLDFDQNATMVWNIHYIKLYNPYYEPYEEPTPTSAPE